MRLSFVLVLVLMLTAAFAGTEARAHESGHVRSHGNLAAAEHHAAAAVASDAAKTAALTILHPHNHGQEGHRDASHCLTAVGCAGIASVIGEECDVPAPQRITNALLFISGDRPREATPPVEDQPPRRS